MADLGVSDISPTPPARTWPNFFDDPTLYNRVTIAGVLVLAILTEIDGVSVEDTWKAQKSKETNGQVNVFNGTKNVGGEKGFKLTFRAFDRASFAQLEDIWNALAPVPGLGSATTAPAASPTSNAPTSAIGSPPASAEALIAQAQASLAALSNPSNAQQSAANDAGPAASSATSSEPSPGPRPPTVLIENALLAIMGVTAVARASWAWKPAVNNTAWDVTIGFIQDKLPTPAGVGAQAPAFASFATTPGAGFAGASASSSAAQASAAGT